MVGFTVGFILGFVTHYAWCKYGRKCECKNIWNNESKALKKDECCSNENE